MHRSSMNKEESMDVIVIKEKKTKYKHVMTDIVINEKINK